MVKGLCDSFEEGGLTFGRELEACPVRVGPDLVAECGDDLGDVALAMFEWDADCQVDAPEGVLVCGRPFLGPLEGIIHVGQLRDRRSLRRIAQTPWLMAVYTHTALRAPKGRARWA